MGCMNFGMIQAMIIIFRQENGELRRILMLRNYMAKLHEQIVDNMRKRHYPALGDL